MKKNFLTFFFIVCFAWVGHAQVITFNLNDFSDTSGLNLNGDSSVVNNGIDAEPVLRLANNASFSEGTVYSTSQINAADFSTRFQFRVSNGGGISDISGESGADGLAFVVQTVDSGVGTSGGGLGYQNLSPSVAVEFDTFHNSWDPSTNHIGVGINGNITSTATADYLSSRFDNLGLWTAWIDYDGTTLEIRANETGIRPTSTFLSLELDIESILGQGDAFIGFSAATGAAYGNHDLVSWQYSSEFIEGGIPEIPEPSSIAVLSVACMGAFLILRRNRRSRRST